MIMGFSVTLISCSNKENIEVHKAEEAEEEIRKSEDRLGSKEDYLKYSTYKGIVKESTGNGLFNKVTLKEPLYAKGKIIDGGEVTRKLEEEKSKTEDGEEDAQDELNKDIDILSVDKSEYMYNLREKIGSQLINNGYLLLYSDTEDEIFNSEFAIKKIKTVSESLDNINSTLNILVPDDEKLTDSWSILYEQLKNSNSLIESLSEEYSIEECKNDINLEAILDSYSNFEIILNSYIVNN